MSNSGYNATTWPATAGNISYWCGGYVSSDAGTTGGAALSHATGANRYYAAVSSGMSCATRNRLVCIVDP